MHTTPEISTEQKQWRRAVDSLLKLAELERDAARRAKYFYTAAVISRDEMKENDEALEHLSPAPDAAPSLPKAFQAREKIPREKGHWKGPGAPQPQKKNGTRPTAHPPQRPRLGGAQVNLARCVERVAVHRHDVPPLRPPRERAIGWRLLLFFRSRCGLVAVQFIR